jgi:hypothetical protein
MDIYVTQGSGSNNPPLEVVAEVLEPITIIDSSKKEYVTVPLEPGKYELKRVKNPYDFPDEWWYVLKTQPSVGMSTVAWRSNRHCIKLL